MYKKLLIILITGLLIPLFSVNAGDALSSKLKGRILLQIESHGEAWYVNPRTEQRHYMANGSEAYNIMRSLGVGITNTDLNNIKSNKELAKKQAGKIFLQVESHGEAYYVNFDGNIYYLKNGDEAYNIMRDLGLGIKNSDLGKVKIFRVGGNDLASVITQLLKDKIIVLQEIITNIDELKDIQDIYLQKISGNSYYQEEMEDIKLYSENLDNAEKIIYSWLSSSEEKLKELNNVDLVNSFNSLNDTEADKVIQKIKDSYNDDYTNLLLPVNDALIKNKKTIQDRLTNYLNLKNWFASKCTGPLDEELRTLSPTQQSMIRNAMCGKDNSYLELQYKLEQQQKYINCRLDNVNNDYYSCDYLKPSL